MVVLLTPQVVLAVLVVVELASNQPLLLVLPILAVVEVVDMDCQALRGPVAQVL